ncbi:MAG: 6-bladed beta-propeller [Actinobacteria bacterium]|nr:MAG: 6-bladed beta-propeller [Actinomycetota bacterium]
MTDQLNNRIEKFSATGRLLAVWGTGAAGKGDGQFDTPHAVAVDGWGNVYVADTRNNRIQKLSPTGRFLARWGANGGDGTAGLGNGEFNDPRGIAVDEAGNVYVADHNNNRIQKLSPTGRFLARWGRNGGDGSAGSGNGEFNQPRGLAIDHAGNIYVAEKLNNRIQELSPAGAFIRRWGANGGDGTAGTGNGEFNVPYSVALDGAGNLYVTDVNNNRIQRFSTTGAFRGRFGHNFGDGSAGAGPGEFDEPYGVATDCRGNVYVTDEGNSRVQKLGVAGTPAPICPPVLAVRVAARRRALMATVSCDRPCTATLQATVGRVRGRGVRAHLVPGRAVRVRLALRAAQVRPGRRAMVTATARGLAGAAQTVRMTVAA